MLRELHLTFHKESRDRYANNENRPDVVYDTDDGVSSDLDISIGHPCSSDMVKKSNDQSRIQQSRRESSETFGGKG